MNIGSRVKIVKCDVCPKVVGKIAKVKAVWENGSVELQFGRGRPQKDRPTAYSVNDLDMVNLS